MQVATKNNKKVAVRMILDTGTKPDWISHRFLTETLKMSYTKLNDNESKQIFKDFNGNAFNAIGKAEVMVSSTDFIGFSCRTLSFLVAQGSQIDILLGRKTIRKEKLLERPLPRKGGGTFPAVQADPKKGSNYTKSFIFALILTFFLKWNKVS
jgi:hypothetical protein